jgi:hypothetical protein
MKLYQVKVPGQCSVDGCSNQDAILIVQTDEGTMLAVCPECIQNMSDMNNDNEEFFAQVPLPML